MKKKLIITGIIILVLLLTIFFCSKYIGPKGLKVKEYAVTNQLVPESFNGFKIVHFSDLHIGSTNNINDFKKITKTINEYNPEIIVFTGDLLGDTNTFSDEEIIACLNDLEALLGKYYVTGANDDETSNAIFNKTDFIKIDDMEKLIYYKGVTPISLSGYYESNSEIENNDYYKITITHNPENIDNINTNLLLAGSTHKGQIVLPFIGGIIRENKNDYYKDDKFTINDTELYVSSGLGTNKYHYRLFNKPSINVYRLYNK